MTDIGDDSPDTLTMESRWLARAKRLQALASNGLHFCRNEYDRDRYEELAAIANDMLADLGNVPLARIAELVPDFAQGYATPKVDVRGAVIEGDAILLVREVSDGLWTLPGGFADVGLSAARNVEKEMLEEAALCVAAHTLYGVRHKAAHPYDQDSRDFYKLFFLCRRLDARLPRAGGETSDVGFFRLNALPPLSRGRVIEQDLEAALTYSREPGLSAFFD